MLMPDRDHSRLTLLPAITSLAARSASRSKESLASRIRKLLDAGLLGAFALGAGAVSRFLASIATLMVSNLCPARGPFAFRTSDLPKVRVRVAIGPALTPVCGESEPTHHVLQDRIRLGTAPFAAPPPTPFAQPVLSLSKPAGRWSLALGSYPAPRFSVGERTLDFLRLQPGRLQQMFHGNGFCRLRCQKGGIQSDIADAAASNIELGQFPGI